MEILPAIDIYDGKAVRLKRGQYSEMTVYSDNPADFALRFWECGARWIHLVDLQGARDGDGAGFTVISEIIRKTPAKAEVGGGIRSYDDAARYLGAGAERVILGTAAVEDTALLQRLVREFGEKIAVGVDVRGDFVAVRGWTETTVVTIDEFMDRLESIGVSTVICTDISKDGVMKGPNTALYEKLARRAVKIIASGGVTSVDDIKALREIGAHGAILGRAIYEGAIDLREAIDSAK